MCYFHVVCEIGVFLTDFVTDIASERSFVSVKFSIMVEETVSFGKCSITKIAFPVWFLCGRAWICLA